MIKSNIKHYLVNYNCIVLWPSTPLIGIAVVAGVAMATRGAVLVRPFPAILACYPLLPAPDERLPAHDTRPLLVIFVIPLAYLRF